MSAVPHNLAASMGGRASRLLAQLRLSRSLKERGRTMIVARSAWTTPHASKGNALLVIRAPEDLSEDNAVRAIHAAARKAMANGASEILVDLADVIRADTKIVACLVVLRNTARRTGCTLDVRLSPAVAAWTGVCRLQQVLRPEDSTTSAA